MVHWPLMGGLLHLVQQGGAWASCGPTQVPPGHTNFIIRCGTITASALSRVNWYRIIRETMASEAASLGLEVNWQKTKIQALGCREDMPLTIKVQGQDVMVVEEFVYLGSPIHSTTVSLPSGRLEKTTRSSPHHVAQHRTTGSEKQHHLTLPEAADLAQNCPLWMMMSTYGATQS